MEELLERVAQLAMNDGTIDRSIPALQHKLV